MDSMSTRKLFLILSQEKKKTSLVFFFKEIVLLKLGFFTDTLLFLFIIVRFTILNLLNYFGDPLTKLFI